jgi:flavin reductase (DIM6/NTAB) family NADH-FMN oxidoreductase RutF
VGERRLAALPVPGQHVVLAGDLERAVFECDLEASYPFGRYDIVVGRVVSARARDNQPLVHCDGRLWRLSEIA